MFQIPIDHSVDIFEAWCNESLTRSGSECDFTVVEQLTGATVKCDGWENISVNYYSKKLDILQANLSLLRKVETAQSVV